MSKLTTIKSNVRHQLNNFYSPAPWSFYRLKITRLTEIDKNSKPWVQTRNLQSNFLHWIWPAPSSHQKGTVIIVRLSFVRRSRSVVNALGSGHECFQFFNQTNPITFLAFDTSNLLLFLVRNESSPLGIPFVAVALDFQVFLAQTIRLKQSNSKEPERSRCCRGTAKWRNQLNGCSANSGASIFAARPIRSK